MTSRSPADALAGGELQPWASRIQAVVQSGIELAELEMTSPLFDRAPGGTTLPSHHLLILSAPRSGSYFLCRRLWLDGLGLPMEYLNAKHLKLMGRRQPLPLTPRRWRDRPEQRLQQTLHALSQRRQAHGWFSLKLQPLQLKPWCRLKQTPLDLLDQQFNSWQILPLLRRDWHRQLASFIVSRATGAFDQGLIHTSSDKAGASGPLLTEKRLHTCHRLLWQDTEMVMQWAHQHPHHQPLIFEELLRWDAARWQQELRTRLPGLAEPDQAPLLANIGRIVLQRRLDPFRDAKNGLIESVADQLRNRPEASPPEGFAALVTPRATATA